MKITLEQTDIEAALTEYLGSQGLNIRAMDVSVELIAGRSGNGHRAEIELSPNSTATTPPADPINRTLLATGTETLSTDEEPAPVADPEVGLEATGEGASLFNK